MASPKVREWVGIQQFPEATQTKLHELLGKLKQENVTTLTILVMGKGGVGKSSTVNSLIGERVVSVSAFQSEGPRPVMVQRSRAGFTLNVIDTPGLIEGGYVNDQALAIIKQFLLNKTIDVLLYVDRLDSYRVDTLDRQVIRAITDSFGKAIWHRSLLVLTHAQLSPPDGLNYDDFFSRRADGLLKVVHLGAQIKRQELKDSEIPVVLVENSVRCQTNQDDEKILPNGTAWIPNLVETITEVVLKGGKSILVDKKLVEGPNPNEKHKFLIPLILAVQYFFVVKPIQRSIRDHPWLQNAKKAPNVPLGDIVRTRLKQFSAMNRFKKKAMRVIAEHLSIEEVEVIRDMFKLMDTDNNGKITFEELKAGLQKVGSQLAEPEMKMLMEVADVDGSGTLDYGEFVAVTVHLQRMENDEHFRRAFMFFDKDGSGYIEREELQAALVDESGEVDVEILNDIIREVDTDKDGRISYDEFVAMMKTGTDWRKASRHYSRERFKSLSLNLMRDGSLKIGNEIDGQTAVS